MKVVQLDEVLRDIAVPAIMKIDTETTEPDVIAGARHLLQVARPIIFVEVLPDHDTGTVLETELEAAGYSFTAYLITDRGLERWRNFLLVPHEGPTVAALGSLIRDLVQS